MASRAPEWRESVKRGAIRSGALIGAIALALGALLLVLALASYRPSDPSMNTAAGGPVNNLLGLPGAWISDFLLWLLGPCVGLFVPQMLINARRLWAKVSVLGWKRRALGALGGIALIDTGLALFRPGAFENLPGGLGGTVGVTVGGILQWLMSFAPPADWMTWVRWGLAAVIALGGIVIWARSLGLDEDERAWLFRRRQKDDAVRALPAPFDEEDDVMPARPEPQRPTISEPRPAPVIDEGRTKPVIQDKPAPAAPKAAEKSSQTALPLGDRYVLPSLDLLSPAPASAASPLDKVALERNARLLETVLDDFHVKGQIVEVRPGPVVTMYELEPASGIKASRVIQLADDIARNMSALSARVATIPGRTVIGIELPNQKRESVVLHELIASHAFNEQSGQLPIVLGKNIAGDPVIADLAPMPHLLVAGTTGSGKSVGLNAMIVSLLYRLTPDQCRMIMIDPKMLELSIYDDIPHLLSPVVTEPAKAIRALKWAVEQMEDRYRMMASVGVRSLASFNEKVRSANQKGAFLGRRVQTGYDSATGQPIYEEEQLDYQPLPQIVVIVDELADLMMTAGKEVEFLIQRLAQKARAAGIHLIMATQRPSVDVITGVIKANLPTRISFAVTSKIDSRTILGEQGAEQLLGKGDMLYMPGGKQIARVHGPFVSDEEVRAVADHWRSQGSPEYIQAVTEEPEEGGWDMEGAPTGEDSAEDQMYRKALQVVAESQKASTSYIQRQLRIGYNSAARLIERMELEGKVSRPDHVGRREVLIDPDGHAI
ncbi:DNA translocase FtsK [Chakrabartia godavariana]|nr:DNA translocase FtsK [Chakrabartia godavariana]